MYRILIIDDDESIGNLEQEVLERAGYAVQRAFSGTEALLLLKQKRPDMILLDLMLPGISGEELLPQIVPDIQMTEIKVMRFLDKVALRRIFDNILSNAARYTDGDLSVKLFSDGRITFSNHAAKLDRIQAERLFERFYTVESAKNSTGLGLSIARLLTEKMAGNIKTEYADEVLVIQVRF